MLLNFTAIKGLGYSISSWNGILIYLPTGEVGDLDVELVQLTETQSMIEARLKQGAIRFGCYCPKRVYPIQEGCSLTTNVNLIFIDFSQTKAHFSMFQQRWVLSPQECVNTNYCVGWFE